MNENRGRFFGIFMAFVWVSIGLVVGATLFKLGENRGEATPSYTFSNFDMARLMKEVKLKYTPHRAVPNMINRRRGAFVLVQSGTITAPKGAFVAYKLHRKMREATLRFSTGVPLPVQGDVLGNAKATRGTPSFAVFSYQNDNERPRRMGRVMLWLFPNADETMVDVAVMLREDEDTLPPDK